MTRLISAATETYDDFSPGFIPLVADDRAARVLWLRGDQHGTPGMGVNLSGESPVYEGEPSRSTVYQMSTPIGASTRRRQLRIRPWEGSRSQTCEATYRNCIQGRRGQASGPGATKPYHPAAKVNAELAQGKSTFLSGESCPTYLGVALDAKARAVHAKVTRCRTEGSRPHSTGSHTPLRPGRTERCRTRRSHR